MTTIRRCGWLLALALSVPGHASGESVREQFAYAARIAIWPGASLQWLELPLAAYRDATDPGLRDLRVLNGRGEVVPFALQRPASVVTRRAAELRLAMFPLRGEQGDEPSALSLTIRGDTTSLEVQGGIAPAEAPLAAYLIDARGVDAMLESLVFQLPEGAADFSVSAILEVSEDLAHWRGVGGMVPLARLSHGGATFENRTASFPATRASYWRLRAPPGATLPPFTGVLAAPVAGNIAVARQELTVAGQRTDEPGEYSFDLGAQLPVDRLSLELPEVNTVAQVDYFARRAAHEPWRHVTRTGVYRLQGLQGLQASGDELRSPPLDVEANASRFWKVVVDPRGGGLGAGVPGLRAGWLPHRVLFVARGTAPFELAYGNYAAESAETPLAELLPGGTLSADATLSQPAAQITEPVIAGGPERLVAPAPPDNWRLGVLWAALAAGVFSLATVAWRLARQMRASS
jgi:hypothetical protein